MSEKETMNDMLQAAISERNQYEKIIITLMSDYLTHKTRKYTGSEIAVRIAKAMNDVNKSNGKYAE